MRKIRKTAALMLMCLCFLCGCTKSTIINPARDNAEFPAVSEDGIAWSQLWEDLASTFEDTDIYPFAGTVNGGLYPEENTFKLFLLVNEDISKEEAAAYATEVVKGVGDLMSMQNSKYTPSSDTSYGSYLDAYDIYVMVANDDTKADESSWILEETIPAGQYREFGTAAE